MQRARGISFGLLANVALGLFAGGTAQAEAPTTLVASGANQVSYTGNPNVLSGDPGTFWYTPPSCSGVGAASDGTSPAQIFRGTTDAATPRTLLSVNPPRSASTCNPYRLISNIAADPTDIYFVDNQGPDGHFALQRRSRDANAADPSTLLRDLGTAVDSVEVNAEYPTVLFTILHRAGQLDGISEYLKSDGGQLAASFEIGSPGAIRNLQYDGKWLYWLNGTALRANDTNNGFRKTVVASGVSAYFAEGNYIGGCNPGGCDPDVAFVLYGKGNQILLTDTEGPIDPGYPPYYTASDPNATIHAITRDNLDIVYHLERRAAVPGGVFDREERLYRNSTLIFGPVNNGGPGFDSLTTDLGFLYFRNRATNALLKLRNYATAVPIYDLRGTGIEVTQGIQNPANDVTLIEGKRTMVRFYVKSNDARSVAGVTAFLDVYDTQRYLGRLEPVNRVGKKLLVRPDPLRMNINDSFLFEVPLDWTFSTALTFQGIVNPLAGVVEDDFSNNSASSPLLIFTQSPRMLLEVVEFRYSNGGPLATGGVFDDVNSVRYMRELYPVASTNSGGINDPGPGLRVNFSSVTNNVLENRVNQTDDACNSLICKTDKETKCCSAGQTDKDCTDMLAKEKGTLTDDRNQCAGDFVVQQLQALRATGAIPKDRYIYGSIAYGTAPATMFTRGFTVGGAISVGPMKDPSAEQNYMAHEVGHALGRAHPTPGAAPTCPGQSAGDDAYPYVAARIGGRLVAGGPFGGPNVPDEVAHARFDFGDPNNPLNPIPRIVGASTAGDIMSYCPPYGISSWNFEAIYNRLAFFPLAAAGLPRANAAAIPGDWLLAFGSFPRTSGTGAFGVVRRFDTVAEVPPLVDGGYAFELRDGAGALLASHPFTPTGNAEGGELSLAFGVVVPFEPGTRTLRVVESATSRVVASHAVSAGRPELSDVHLEGAPDPVTGVVTLAWTASDPDGDPLSFDIFYTHDAGVTWRPVGLAQSGTSVPVESEALPGGTGQFRVEASDGAQSARAESAPFRVAEKPPVVRIANPAGGTQLQFNQLVNLIGEVEDPQQQPIPAADIHWSNAYRSLGTGAAVSVSDLEVGTNVITLSARNAAGLTATTNVTVVVGDKITLPGPILASTPSALSWNVEGNVTALQTGSLFVTNVGGGDSVGFTATSNQPWLTVNGAASASLATSATLAISADPSGLPDLSTSPAEIQIASASDPSKVVVVPVTLRKGSLVSGQPFADADGDGVADDHDNCTLEPNADQRDSNGDGYGNACDPDLNGDGIVNFGDLAKLKSVFFKANEDADLNGDGIVNFADLARLKAMFFLPPGPSAKAP
jgi:hypothetical protein